MLQRSSDTLRKLAAKAHKASSETLFGRLCDNDLAKKLVASRDYETLQRDFPEIYALVMKERSAEAARTRDRIAYREEVVFGEYEAQGRFRHERFKG